MISAIALAVSLTSGQVIELDVNGVTRKALVYAPSVRTASASPLVFGFHGHGGNMNFAARNYDVQDRWPEAIAVYPDGLPTKGITDPTGSKQGWQQKAGDYDNRDLAFFDKLLARVKRDFRVDSKRIYTMGHSNGARFSYLLWAERGDTFAAFGISGSPMIPGLKPRSAFCIAGKSDPIVPYRFQQMSINRLEKILNVDTRNSKSSGFATWMTNANGDELGTYIHDGGHNYPADGAVMTIDLFKRHHL